MTFFDIKVASFGIKVANCKKNVRRKVYVRIKRVSSIFGRFWRGGGSATSYRRRRNGARIRGEKGKQGRRGVTAVAGDCPMPPLFPLLSRWPAHHSANLDWRNLQLYHSTTRHIISQRTE